MNLLGREIYGNINHGHRPGHGGADAILHSSGKSQCATEGHRHAAVYLSEGEAEGVRGDIAFCQSCIETGNFGFAGSAVTLDQNNFAGIGVTSNGMKGNSWDTPQLGIRAQIQHLKAYGSVEPLEQNCVDPRFKWVKRNSAPFVEWLGQQENPLGSGWAKGKNYGNKILTVLDSVLQEDKGDNAMKVFTGEGKKPGQGANGDILYQNKKFKNFELSVDWKASKMGNSGIFYYVREVPGKPIYYAAPEVQVLDNVDATDNKLANHLAGSLYDMLPADPKTVNPAGEWNTIVIRVKDGKVTHTQNGKKVVEYTLWSKEWMIW